MHQARITSYMSFTQSSSQTLDTFALFDFDLVKNTPLDAAMAVNQRTSHTSSLPSDFGRPMPTSPLEHQFSLLVMALAPITGSLL